MCTLHGKLVFPDISLNSRVMLGSRQHFWTTMCALRVVKQQARQEEDMQRATTTSLYCGVSEMH